jgi:hypothetical protein
MALGSWRFFLALLVAVSHLWDGFFLISGYLMTLGFQTRYSDGWGGLRDYAFNRFLRIYPAYYLACLLGYVALVVMPLQGVNPSILNGQFVLPQHWRDWATNISLLPIWGGGNLLVPVSGALGLADPPDGQGPLSGMAGVDLQRHAQLAIRYRDTKICRTLFAFSDQFHGICHWRFGGPLPGFPAALACTLVE